MKYFLKPQSAKYSRFRWTENLDRNTIFFPSVVLSLGLESLRNIFKGALKVSFILGGFIASSVSFGEDIDLFVGEASGSAQVLIIFDNSGSMSTIVEADKPAYDSLITYDTQGSVSSSR
ncbi:MAG: hypothetical protein KUG66_02875, partial [Gammaproteobacteria bacterium]|nr:hypothetical protein [Gammaproteobacteria bacterium]